jgi:putative DNA methylase
MKKKLIEVALPLEVINVQAAREKSIRHGHPSTLHLWWARRPLAACRAVLFASLVDDPSSNPDKFPTEAEREAERRRLFRIIERLVDWDNTKDEKLYREAYNEILASTGGNPPPVLDPFAGGGSIPLEAQRLGLEAHASDLNPVAVLINKALIEIPPRFANRPPVNPDARVKIGGSSEWKGAVGLAEDVRYYGEWMRQKAFERVGHLYPTVSVPATATTERYEATVIAWIWARTVKCPNPACGAEMPLVRSFELSKKKGKEAWVNPRVSKDKKSVVFEVRHGKIAARRDGTFLRNGFIKRDGTIPGTVNRNGARCICCGSPVGFPHIRDEGKAGRMGAKLMAIVADGQGGRVYLSPEEAHVKAADVPKPKDYSDGVLQGKVAVNVPLYGLNKFSDLFTPRQFTALTTFSDLVGEAIARVQADTLAAGLPADGKGLDAGGNGARAYGEAVGVYLACAVDRMVMTGNSLVRWNSTGQKAQHCFGRQALPMLWDYAEPNFFAEATGSFATAVFYSHDSIPTAISGLMGSVTQKDARKIEENSIIISTDPPYYDNIGYADLSDFFYIWLRRSLQKVYPSLFSTMLVPKAEELVATPYRFDGNKEKAKVFFEEGMLKAFQKMRETVNHDFPLTVYYAYKQSENEEDEKTRNSETASSGWETMLKAIIKSGFSITGTWPLRTEMRTRQVAMNANALASSIAIVCRPRPEDAPSTTRRAFQTELREALKTGLHDLQSGNIAPVDLAQASIGPGIAVYSKYREILEAGGTPLSVRQALVMINQELDAYLGEQEGSLDGDSRFCVAWFEQHGLEEGTYGEAETLFRARMASEKRLVEGSLLEASRGRVRLKKRDEIAFDLFAKSDRIVWGIVQHLCHALDAADGLDRCAGLMADLSPDTVEQVKALSYRIYQICDRKGWAEEALAYNNLVALWGALEGKAKDIKKHQPVQGELPY